MGWNLGLTPSAWGATEELEAEWGQYVWDMFQTCFCVLDESSDEMDWVYRLALCCKV